MAGSSISVVRKNWLYLKAMPRSVGVADFAIVANGYNG
jgi:hypothetical protein